VNAVIRKTGLILSALVVVLVLAVVVLALVIGPVLNSDGMRRLEENAVHSLTGFACQIERVRFAHPFELTVDGVRLEGPAGEGVFSVYIGRARIASGAKSLVRGRLDEIQVDAVELEIGVLGEGPTERPAALEGRAFEIPDWVWRIKKASVRVATARVSSTKGSACLENLYADWICRAETTSGTLKISLDDRTGQPEDVILGVTPQSVTAIPTPAVLPVLDLPPLLGLAGLDVRLTGTLSGAVFPLPGPDGLEALYLEFLSEDLALDDQRFSAGFDRGSLRLGAFVFPPRRGTGLSVFLEDVTASVEGLTVDGERPGTGLPPLDLSGSLGFDTLSDNADWALDARDRPENVRVRAQGTLAGVLSGRRETTASVLAKCADLDALATALYSQAPLPEGATLEGGLSVAADLAGSIESMDLKGTIRSSGLRVGSGRLPTIPVHLDGRFSGSFQKGTPEALLFETNRLDVGDLATPRASLAYGPGGVTVTITIDSIDAQRLASLLGPLLPQHLAGYQWGGSLALSGNARMGNQEGSPIQGNLTATLRNGQFASPDYQRMGEEIDFDLNGAFRVPPAGAPVELVVDASLPKGEIVVGEHYGDLSKTRPSLRAEIGLDSKGRTLHLRSAGLALDGVGSVGIEGRFSQGPRGVRATTRIQVGPVRLDALLDRIVRDGVGGLYPGIKEMTTAGTLAVTTDLDVEGGSYRARGRLDLEDAWLKDPSKGLSARKIDLNLPFSLAASPDPTPSRPPEEDPKLPGALTVEGIDLKGIEIRKLHARVLLAGNRLALEEPMRIELAGGSVSIPEFVLQGLGSARQKGRAAVEIDGVDLAPLARAMAGKAIEGRLKGRFDGLMLEDGTWEAAGRLGLRIRGGELLVQNIELRAPPSGSPSGRCEVRAEGIPLEALSREFLQTPLEGTLDADLPAVALSQGKLETKGSLTLSSFGGTITVSKIRAAGLPGPTPVAQLDVDLEEIDLMALTAPLRFGRVSGVLRGRVHGLRVGPGFPYATAFDADLETVKRRGVPRKIDATAVTTLSKIGGSNQLAAVLSVGLYRFFDEYYYRKMGIRAVLEDGWLELHGIPKGKEEYLIIRALRVPTLSMPITVMTQNQKIRFNRWLTDVIRVGERR
jgi:hypothetical protein